MKVTIKRRTGTTVPRKLELVNVRCVQVSPSQWEKPMNVSESKAAVGTALPPLSSGADIPPPFWELEELIARGFSHERALVTMAARRSGQYPAMPSSRCVHAPDRQQATHGETLAVLLAGR